MEMKRQPPTKGNKCDLVAARNPREAELLGRKNDMAVMLSDSEDGYCCGWVADCAFRGILLLLLESGHRIECDLNEVHFMDKDYDQPGLANDGDVWLGWTTWYCTSCPEGDSGVPNIGAYGIYEDSNVCGE